MQKFKFFISNGSSHFRLEKVITTGIVIGYDSKGRQIQEVMETCYHFLRFRFIIYHNLKFKVYE